MGDECVELISKDSMPNRVKVGGAVYNVDRTSNLHAENGDLRLGECDFLHHVISINTDDCVSSTAARQTFAHELMHAICNMMGISEINEDNINKLATGIQIVATDNPHLFGYIGGRR